MTPQRWQQIKSLLEAALDVPAEDREAFLDRSCAGDEALREEVASLLAVHGEAPDYFEAFAADLTPRSTEAERRLGARVGPYRLVRLLGRGGMGAVYLAERADGQFEQRVALKLVRGAHDPELVQRFLGERQILARLQHPNIARLLDGGLADPGLDAAGERVPYLAMEYVEGLPLTTYCDQNRLSVDERLRLFLTICEAVRYAHRNLVVHRDIKPSNILVTEEGRIKLLDFGIAKLLDPETEDRGGVETRTGARLMTPEYASPEQIRGEAITTTSDVYQLGVLLYELLTGHRPYRLPERLRREVERVILEEEPERPSTAVTRADGRAAETPAATGARIGRARGTSLDRLRRRLSGDLDTIALVALRKEPDRRYGSVEALAEDVRRHLEGLPVEARGDTLGYRAAKFVRRHRSAVGAAALVAASLVAGLGAALWQARLAQHQQARSDRIAGFLTELFRSPHPFAPDTTWGPDVTVREFLHQSFLRVREELTDQPDIQIELLRTMGQAFNGLGDYPSMHRIAEETHRLTVVHYGEESPEAVRTLGDLAWASAWSGDTTVVVLLRRRLEFARRVYPEGHPEVGYALNDLGYVLEDRGRAREAETVLAEAVALFRAAGDAQEGDLASVLENHARALYALDRHEEVRAEMEEALALTEAQFGPNHPNVGVRLGNMTHFLSTTDPRRAEELGRRSVDLLARAGARGTVAAVRRHLGRAIEEQGRIEEALGIYEEEVAYLASLPEGDRSFRLARMLQSTGAVLVEMERWQEAEATYRRALAVLRGAFPDGRHVEVGTTLLALADLAERRGAFGEAEQRVREAREALTETVGEEHPTTREAERRLERLLASR